MTALNLKILRMHYIGSLSLAIKNTFALLAAPFADGKVWDPVGLSSEADPADIKKWREAEIKHGRVVRTCCP